MPDTRRKILVEVLSGTQSFSCGYGCGDCSCASDIKCDADMDFEEQTRDMADEFAKVYNEQVVIQYIDVDKVGLVNYPVMERLLAIGYPYPIILINGKPRFAGAIMKPDIREIIDKLLDESEH